MELASEYVLKLTDREYGALRVLAQGLCRDDVEKALRGLDYVGPEMDAMADDVMVLMTNLA